MMPDVTVVGGGLAGCEAAWQAAERGLTVHIFEMRPFLQTGAHATGDLAELVCSNSLGSVLPDRPAGIMQHELSAMGSMLLACAKATAVPAGNALAVDRALFAKMVTEKIAGHPSIHLVRKEITEIPEGLVIIATGPLTSPSLSHRLQRLTGTDLLYFFDAIAPIVDADSIDRGIVFSDARRNASDDYINCPFTKEEYYAFVEALCAAERAPLKDFEKDIEDGVRAGATRFFEGCLPIEKIAARGKDTLAYGPMRPIFLRDPKTNERPFAVVQLRQEDRAQTMYNIVGFQTNLTIPEQRRIFRMIPGLANAEFLRYGQMHRNTFLNAPRLLLPTLQFRMRDDLFFAGQITGVEGYAGNIATGLLAGWNAARLARGKDPLRPPPETMVGALCHHITSVEEKLFQPTKANFGIFPPLEKRPREKMERNAKFVERENQALRDWLDEVKREETGLSR